MLLAEHYRQVVTSAGFAPDAHQQTVVEALGRLLEELEAPPYRLGLFRRRPSLPVRGLYLWGGVGRGKTWLMDLFFEVLPEERKERLHFHRFMQGVHGGLARFEGRPEPLSLLARDIARRIRVLCLDELNVIDIGDAMILAGLLRALFAQGVTLVTTSNQPPENLYPNGIQRASFLPAIALLQSHTRVLELGGRHDYRRQVLEEAAVYHCPLGEAADARLRAEFARLATEPVEAAGLLDILGRSIPFRRRSGGLVWFDFDRLCGPPRSQNDYIEVARCHHTVIISGIPQLDAAREDRSRRFIFLIDELYDRRVKLVVSAETTPEQLYCGERLAFEFQRTASRLQEMQSRAYLGLRHRG